jgi:hypothetical protein
VRPSAEDALGAALIIRDRHTTIGWSELAVDRAACEELRRFASASKARRDEDLRRLQRIVDSAGQTSIPEEPQVERMNQLHLRLLHSLSSTDFDRHSPWTEV